MKNIAVILMYTGVLFGSFCFGVIVGAGVTYDGQYEKDYTITVDNQSPNKFEFHQLKCREVKR